MGKFQVTDSNGKILWIKSVDNVNGKLEFTEKESEAYNRDGDYYTRAEAEFIKFHFKEEYPEVNNIKAVHLCFGETYQP